MMEVGSSSLSLMIVADTSAGSFGGAENNALEAARANAASGGRTILVEVGQPVIANVAAPHGVELVHIESVGMDRVPLRKWRALLAEYRVQAVIRSKNWVGSVSWKLDLAVRQTRRLYLSWEHHPGDLNLAVKSNFIVADSMVRGLKRSMRNKLHVRSVQKTICASHAVRTPLIEQFGFAPDTVDVVYPGVDFEKFRFDAQRRAAMRAQWEVPASAIVIGTMGRLVAYKGNDLVLQVFASLRKQRPSIEMYCVIAGTGEDLPRLKEIAESLEVADRTRFVGWQAHAPSVWSAIDIFPLASRDEGLGMALIESIACGGIALARNVGGTSEVLGVADRSLLIESEQHEDWTRRITQLLDQSEAERRAYHCMLYERMRSRFDGATQWPAMLHWISDQLPPANGARVALTVQPAV